MSYLKAKGILKLKIFDVYFKIKSITEAKQTKNVLFLRADIDGGLRN